MTKTDYTALDAAILERIRSRSEADLGLVLSCAKVSDEATGIAHEANDRKGVHPLARGATYPSTVISIRLQALRRAGKIRYTGKGWVLA